MSSSQSKTPDPKDRSFVLLTLLEDSMLTNLCWWTICKKNPPASWFKTFQIQFKDRVSLTQSYKQLLQSGITEDMVYAVINDNLRSKREATR